MMKGIDVLEELYQARSPYHGELHDHAKTGGTSDGRCPLSHWLGAMDALDMDFAAILDHRQVRHMYLPEWEDGKFICGTEPGTLISDSKATKNAMHYNMIFPTAAALEDLLASFSEYEFTGGQEGHFRYPKFTTARFCELIDGIKARGGFFVHPHPTHLIQSDDPLDYWFRDETGIEVFYYSMDNKFTEQNYELWTKLLALGKRVWATAGGDGHSCCYDGAVTTIYAKELSSAGLLEFLRKGDYVCGGVGIRMCIGDTTMGGKCSFEGKDLVVRVGDFHKSIAFEDHNYRMDVLDDKGVVCSCPVAVDKKRIPVIFNQWGTQQGPEVIEVKDTDFSMPINKDAKFYRVEIFDETRSLRIAIGNPIWNTAMNNMLHF